MSATDGINSSSRQLIAESEPSNLPSPEQASAFQLSTFQHVTNLDAGSPSSLHKEGDANIKAFYEESYKTTLDPRKLAILDKAADDIKKSPANETEIIKKASDDLKKISTNSDIFRLVYTAGTRGDNQQQNIATKLDHAFHLFDQ